MNLNEPYDPKPPCANFRSKECSVRSASSMGKLTLRPVAALGGLALASRICGFGTVSKTAFAIRYGRGGFRMRVNSSDAFSMVSCRLVGFLSHQTPRVSD